MTTAAFTADDFATSVLASDEFNAAYDKATDELLDGLCRAFTPTLDEAREDAARVRCTSDGTRRAAKAVARDHGARVLHDECDLIDGVATVLGTPAVRRTWYVSRDGGFFRISWVADTKNATGPECMVFACDAFGRVTDWEELAVSHAADPIDALDEALRVCW